MNRFFKRYKHLVIFVLALFLITVFIQIINSTKNTKTSNHPTPIPTISITPLPSPTISPITTSTPTPTPPKLSKKLYKVAAIGDSMIETIGGNLDYIYKELKKKYPGSDFYMYNYGISSENIVEGLARFDKPFAHADRSYPSISEIKPDLIIIGSYAYNPPLGDAKTIHFNDLSDLINKSKAITKNVYTLAEIAPLENGFGEGIGGVNWPEDLTKTHVSKIIQLMANARSLPEALGVKLIDVYSKTTLPGTPYGQQKFIDPYDNIHPSIYGHTFMAQNIVSTIKLDGY